MTLARKVMWKEGMFLRPHHFQSQDLRAETLLAARVAALQPFFWGFARLELDTGALEAGRVGLLAAEGAFRDATPFRIPEEAAPVEPVAIPAESRELTVWLAAPLTGAGGALAASPGQAPARYVVEAEDVRDLLREGAETEPVELGASNLRLTVEPDGEGWERLPVARVVEVANGRVRLDPLFVPPCVRAEASTRLASALTEIATRFEARAEQLAGPLSSAGGLSAGALRQLLLLQLCNGRAARFERLRRTLAVHPETLHQLLAETAAELITLTDAASRRPPPAPDYDHDRPDLGLNPLIELILRALGALEDPEARPIPLEYHARQRIHYAQSIPEGMLESSRLFLLAYAAVEDQALRDGLPSKASIGSTGEILQIVAAAARGVPLRPQSHFPSELRQMSGWVCFELDQNAPAWRSVRQSRSIAILAQEGFTDLKLQLWSVKD